jgi:hypothetical protein
VDSASSKEVRISLDSSSYNSKVTTDPYPHRNRGRLFDGVDDFIELAFKINPEFTTSFWVYPLTDEQRPVFSALTLASPYVVKALKGKTVWQHIITGCITTKETQGRSHCYVSSNQNSAYLKDFALEPQELLRFSTAGQGYLGKDDTGYFNGFIYEARVFNYMIQASSLLYSAKCSGTCSACPLNGVCLLNCHENQAAVGGGCQLCDSKCPYCSTDKPCSYCSDSRMFANCKYFGLFDSAAALTDCGADMSKKYSKACIVRGREPCCQGSPAAYCTANYDLDKLCSITAADIDGQYTAAYTRMSFALTFPNQASAQYKCADVFVPESVAKLGSKPNCYWKDSSNYEVILGYDATSAEEALMFKPEALVLTGGRPLKDPLAITVIRVGSVPKPKVVWDLPPYYNTCADLALSAEFTSGLANRSFKVEWTVNGQVQSAGGLKLVLPSGFISGPLELALQVTNKFNETTTERAALEESKFTFLAKVEVPTSLFYAAVALTIPATFQSICKEPPNGLEFRWIDNNNSTLSIGPVFKSKPGDFKPGTSLNMTLELVQNSIVKASTKFKLEPVRSPLESKPSVQGPITLSKFKSIEISLGLYDPDNPIIQSFDVNWTCTVEETGKDCNEVEARFLAASGATYTIPADWKDPGYVYDVTGVGYANNKTVASTTMISYVAQQVPGLSISQLSLVNPCLPFVLQGYVDPISDSDEYSFAWKQVTKFNATYSTNTKQQTLGLTAFGVEPGSVYTFELKVRNSVAYSSASITFTTNSWPENCVFAVFPNEGTELTDVFNFLVEGCSDPEGHLPLQYKYFARKPSGSLESLSPLIDNPYFKMLLGRYDSDELTIVARVYDSYMCYSDLETRVILFTAASKQEQAAKVAEETLAALRESSMDYRQAIANIAAVSASAFASNLTQTQTAADVLDTNAEVFKNSYALEDADFAALADIVRVTTESITSITKDILLKSYEQVIYILTQTETSSQNLTNTQLTSLSNLQTYSESDYCQDSCDNRELLYNAISNVSFAALKNDTINQAPNTYETDNAVIKPIRISASETNSSQTVPSKSDKGDQFSVNFGGTLCKDDCNQQVYDIVLASTPHANSSNETTNSQLVSDTIYISVQTSGNLTLQGDIEGNPSVITGSVSPFTVTLPLFPWNSTEVPCCVVYNGAKGEYEKDTQECKRVNYTEDALICECYTLPVFVQAQLEVEELFNPIPYIIASTKFDFESILDAELFIWVLVPCFATFYIFGFSYFYSVKDTEWKEIVQTKDRHIRAFAIGYMKRYLTASSLHVELNEFNAAKQLERLFFTIVGNNVRIEILAKLNAIITETSYMEQLKLHHSGLLDDIAVSELLNDLFHNPEDIEEALVPMLPTYEHLRRDRGCLKAIWLVIEVCISKIRIESRIWSNWHINLDWSRPSLRFNYNACTFFFCCILAGTSLEFNQSQDTLKVANVSLTLNYYDKIWSAFSSICLALIFWVLDNQTKAAIFMRPRKVKLMEIIGLGLSWCFIAFSLLVITVRASDMKQDLLSEWLYNFAVSVFLAFTINDFLITLLLSLLTDWRPILSEKICFVLRCCKKSRKQIHLERWQSQPGEVELVGI